MHAGVMFGYEGNLATDWPGMTPEELPGNAAQALTTPRVQVSIAVHASVRIGIPCMIEGENYHAKCQALIVHSIAGGVKVQVEFFKLYFGFSMIWDNGYNDKEGTTIGINKHEEGMALIQGTNLCHV